jgi:CheY-like chemotaxis protein
MTPQQSAGHVLIVEDDPDAREALAQILLGSGYNVATAADGHAALLHLRGSPHPCVVVLDLMMPGMDGWQFRAEQLQDPALATIPVVVITAVPRAEQRAAVLDIPDYLTKPIDIERFLETVQRYCISSRGGNGNGNRHSVRSGTQ